MIIYRDWNVPAPYSCLKQGLFRKWNFDTFHTHILVFGLFSNCLRVNLFRKYSALCKFQAFIGNDSIHASMNFFPKNYGTSKCCNRNIGISSSSPTNGQNQIHYSYTTGIWFSMRSTRFFYKCMKFIWPLKLSPIIFEIDLWEHRNENTVFSRRSQIFVDCIPD